jgi:Ca2+-binding EF-hand superfamily protein
MSSIIEKSFDDDNQNEIDESSVFNQTNQTNQTDNNDVDPVESKENDENESLSYEMQLRDTFSIFKKFDLNGDKLISKIELNKMLIEDGSFTIKEIENIFDMIDANANGQIEFNEFFNFMSLVKIKRNADTNSEKSSNNSNKKKLTTKRSRWVKMLFRIIDSNNDGLISTDDIKKTVKDINNEIEMEDVNMLLRIDNLRSNAFIDYEGENLFNSIQFNSKFLLIIIIFF